MFESFVRFVRELYHEPKEAILLHAPVMGSLEKEWVGAAIDSTFVSSVGRFVTEFEQRVADFTGSRYAVATVNGTSALHVALVLVGVAPGDLVLTQALTFVATSNAIRYCGADPVFIDVEEDTLGLSPEALTGWLKAYARRGGDGGCYARASGRRIRACVPMHTLGHPARIDRLVAICAEWGIELVEDAAEALGSTYAGRFCGTFGRMGILSFNGNKIITTGGGGMILTNDECLAQRARHLTTTAKKPHPWAFEHDALGFNYRLPNLNAALGMAQMQRLPDLLEDKRALADAYAEWCKDHALTFVSEPVHACSNYWLNALRLADRNERDAFLEATQAAGVMTRPLWTPMHHLPMYAHAPRGPLPVTEDLAARVVNIPSSARPPRC